MKPGSTLVICFDGLRRDRVLPELMPNLYTFMRSGSDFINSRSVFPSETRVAVTSTITGCSPAAHGLVANQFLHPAISGRPLQTAKIEDLIAAASMGQLIDRLSLGERLSDADRKMAVISTASPGATWMMHPEARCLGHPVFSVHGAPIATEPLYGAAVAALGEVPAAKTGNHARLTYVTRVLTEVLWPEEDPDLCLMWLAEPDTTAHAFGITAPETAQSQKMPIFVLVRYCAGGTLVLGLKTLWSCPITAKYPA
ncbi:alkaline phosphatase family protein [Brucella sp. BE17]|uniref:alkaline phosphatase family protein n=1 Tax=Brucella sp. BE17 TaxID=3142977 RepID=UPI0031BB4BCE